MVTRQPSGEFLCLWKGLFFSNLLILVFLEGRLHAGGLRFGEMERDCLISHAAPNLLSDTFLTRSDKHQMRICKICGDAQGLRGRNDPCLRCGQKETTNVCVPYAFRLLTMELAAVGCHLKFRT